MNRVEENSKRTCLRCSYHMTEQCWSSEKWGTCDAGYENYMRHKRKEREQKQKEKLEKTKVKKNGGNA